MLTNVERRPAFQELVDRMNGSFSSRRQAESNPLYYEVEMDMVEILPDRSDEDEQWFYIEQRLAGGAPYRQRVYHLVDEGNRFRNEIFNLPDEEKYVGLQHLEEIAVDSLDQKVGCDVVLELDHQGHYVGGTQGTSCPRYRNGATYAVSEIEVREDGLTSKDQGFNDDGYLRWGVSGEGYIFDKVS